MNLEKFCSFHLKKNERRNLLNKTSYSGFWRFDELDICLEPWEINNTQDGLGRNAFLYINYPNQKWLKESLLRCIKQRDDSFIQFYRYPEKGADHQSRDHVAAVILALYLNHDWKELEFILDNLPWRISRRYSQTIDFWLWQRTLRFEIKQKHRIKNLLSYTWLFLILLQSVLVVPINFIIRKLLHIRVLNLEDFPNDNVQQFKGSLKKILSKLIYPQFSLFTLTFQLKTIKKGSIINKLIRMILYQDINKENNLVLNYLLTNNPITTTQYNKYKGLTSFIWSRRLDTTDEVYINKMNQSQKQYNDINKSMLDYCYLQLDKIIENKHLIETIKNDKNIFHLH